MLLTHILQKTARKNWFLFAVFTFILSGCTTPTQPQDPNIGLNTGDANVIQLAQAIQSAQQLDSPLKEQRLLAIAKQLSQLEQYSLADNAIQAINPDNLHTSSFIDFTLTANSIALKNSQADRALALLFQPRWLAVEETLNIEQQKQLHQAKSESFSQTGNIKGGIAELVTLGTLLLENEEVTDNNSRIWELLSAFTINDLISLQNSTTSPVTEGWADLGITSKSTEENIEWQQGAITQWLSDNPNHPASLFVPEGISALQKIESSTPQKIALLLPLQGKLASAGKAIRDGFFAAYYNSLANRETNKKPAITVYDTTSSDITSIYQQAINEGAEMVVGPLTKDNVQTLQTIQNINIPTLALNYSEVLIDEESRPFYQLGLSLENEAIQVAERAWQAGHKRALIISSSASWSQRTKDAFAQQWQAYGGTIVADNHYDNDQSYSDTIAALLNINDSKARSKELRRLFGRPFEFEPRRRADIDMIFLISRSADARQIKPTLNFHYAGNIPVYSTKQVYSAQNGVNQNRDLNGIKLTTLPWLVNENTAERQLIRQYINISPSYEQLYALGVDSFALHLRLEQLYQIPSQKLLGVTGSLQIGSNRRVIQNPQWAEIKQGQLRPIQALAVSRD